MVHVSYLGLALGCTLVVMSDTTITPLENGPYLVEGLDDLRDGNGPLEAKPKLALCRCGASANKPLCDGAHGAAGFSSAKLEGGPADKRDDYEGKQLTLHDNRAACAHAGVCTERLPAVWRMGKEPWIDPDAASAEEITEVVRACPSGALGLTPAPPTEERPAAILIVKKGPYAVSGGPKLVGAQFAAGASTERFTLCRCGASKNKPFCDGAHWTAGDWDDAP
jgi:CDGSH-type Zn-finger protein